MDINYKKNGAAEINGMIRAAVDDGSRTTVVKGNYEIEETVVIPSDFTLILDGCRLRMADGTFCNMFTNAARLSTKAHIPEGADYNIVIEGRGNVSLDGGNFNGLAERNHSKDGRPHISVNNMILFANVDGFRITGLHIENQRWWAMNFVFCRHGLIRDIDFRSDYRMVDDDGNFVYGLSWDKHHGHEGVYIKNSDGIDLRTGCHDIVIENITGFTEDDTIALTALNGTTEKLNHVEGLPTGIHNVIIRGVNAASFCAIVRLLNQGGPKLYNILIDGVVDASADVDYLDRGETGIRIGDAYEGYGGRQPTFDETFNITVRNVYSRAKAVIRLSGCVRKLKLDNISTFDDGGGMILDGRAQIAE